MGKSKTIKKIKYGPVASPSHEVSESKQVVG